MIEYEKAKEQVKVKSEELSQKELEISNLKDYKESEKKKLKVSLDDKK